MRSEKQMVDEISNLNALLLIIPDKTTFSGIPDNEQDSNHLQIKASVDTIKTALVNGVVRKESLMNLYPNTHEFYGAMIAFDWLYEIEDFAVPSEDYKTLMPTIN